MKVVGITTQQEVYVGSKDRNFRINEFLIIMDEYQGDLMGEVVEAKTYNRYIPLNINGDLVDSSVLESLKAIGYNVDEDTIYIAKVRLLNEAQYPIETGSDVRVPRFKEVKNLMVKSTKEEGLVLGAIKNTDQMEKDMDEEFKKLLYLFEDGQLIPQKGIPFIFDLKSMHQYPHIGVFGGSGSGKSFGLRVVLEELMKLNIPTIILDPHFEMDFSESQDYMPEEEKEDFNERFKCLQVGYHVGVRFEELNPQDLKNLLDASSPLTDAMNNVVDILFKKNDSFQSFHDRLKMLSEAQEEGSPDKIRRRIEEATTEAERDGWKRRKELYETYDKICPYSSVRGIFWRLKRLENEGIFSNDIHEIEEGLKMGKLIVIQGSTRMLQVFSTYLLNNLYHRRRDFKDAEYKHTTADYFPPFIIVTDEAHNFAPKGYDSPSKSILKEISQEGRKYGVFLILATQRPTLLDETITAQLNTKFIFRTVRASDIQTIKEETDITEEEARRLPYLQSGDVFISSATMGRTIYVRIRASKTTSPHTMNPFDELLNYSQEREEKFYRLIKDKLPINDSQILFTLTEIEKESGEVLNMDQFKERLENLVLKGKIEKVTTPFGDMYK
ncbi:ATP-binding protein [Anaerosalibacter bizertensis]|uniref:ATP-binding protein n=1 Tax=Anaerosalibacter bizertensis TaxID=932217 RepID=A0A9Q4ACD7_9FIRM|nr:ATP-binding protein [Anaerosalibacter bizertensis]MBV1819489.1 ATP-binding protein [Bacteroidales bacterium MSK.15.36]MCG4565309.1 ATP-binding protein [Anaerosalibacter bizertensis]MCG4582163.1 ATP-binding protein [Anaerosalibacter bizertensis]